jgi:hypothetical protein
MVKTMRGSMTRVSRRYGCPSGLAMMQPEEVANAVWEKGGADARFHDPLGIEITYEAKVVKDAGHAGVRGHVDVDVVDARFRHRAEALLHRIHRLDQPRELALLVAGIRAGDVRGVAVALRAGVDEE